MSGRRTAALVALVLALVLLPAAAASAGAAVTPARSATGGDAASQPAAPAAQSAAPSGEITDAEYVGLGFVRDDGNTTYLFDGEPHDLVVDYRTGVDAALADVCVRVTPRDEPGESDEGPATNTTRLCETDAGVDTATTVGNDTAATKRLSFAAWPAGWTGAATVTVELVAERDGEAVVVDRRALAVRVLAPDGDDPGSDLTNAEELRHGTDFARADTTRNGLLDAEELRTYGTDPVDRDTDGNGISDAIEVLLGTDPTNPYTPHAFLLGAAALAGVLVGGAVLSVTSGVDPDGDAAADADREDDGRGGSAGPARPAGPNPDDAGEVLTDGERVRRLVAANGGRVKQGAIVEGTDWSKSKVSRVLSRMEEDDHLSRTRIGRENVVILDGEGDGNGEMPGNGSGSGVGGENPNGSGTGNDGSPDGSRTGGDP